MRIISLATLLILCFSITTKANTKTSGRDTINNIKANIEKDGSSYDKAIVIVETTEGAGETAEYAWIKKHYTGSRPHSQSLNFHEKKSYDIIHITTADGIEVAVYFDISNFYGKF